VALRAGAGEAAGGGTVISGAGTTFATGAAAFALTFGSGLRGASASNSASCGRWTLRPFGAAALLSAETLARITLLSRKRAL